MTALLYASGALFVIDIIVLIFVFAYMQRVRKSDKASPLPKAFTILIITLFALTVIMIFAATTAVIVTKFIK